MILQALYEYYDRKAKLGEIAPIGFEWKEIPFLIVIDNNGVLKRLEDTREQVGNKLVAKPFLVPQSVGRSGKNAWKTTFLLWDHYGYVLGYPKGDAVKDRKKRNTLLNKIEADNQFLTQWKQSTRFLTRLSVQELNDVLKELQSIPDQKEVKTLLKNVKGLIKAHSDSEKQLGTFINALKSLPEKVKAETSIQAIVQFYESEQYKKVPTLANWMDCAGINGANISFQLEGETRLILANSAAVKYQGEQALLPESEDEKKALCLITGKRDFIERLHAATPIMGGQATGKLVGFQKDSGFDSYGKTQAFNAPVGKYAQKAYTTALNTLIKSKNNSAKVGDTTIVFWGEKPTIVEQTMTFVLTKPKDDPDKGALAVKQFYESIYAGKLSTSDQSKFFVLGLSPNSARIAVRYWISGTVGEFANHIKQHFDDLKIIHDKDSPDFFALSSLLSHTALDYKMDNVTPNLAGQVTESALKGFLYPHSLLQAAVRRIRADQNKKINDRPVQNVTRIRAAIIKACINRFNRVHNKNEEVIKVSLDKTNENPAYLLGRLFAVLERVQERAFWDEKRNRCSLNSTIRNRYYSSFSSAPVTVFSQLMRLKEHHLDKFPNSKVAEKRAYENKIGEIIDLLDGTGKIPHQLNLDQQGRFAVGYYHQRQDLKFKEENNNTMENIEEKTNE